jgi:hypothetical protein
MADSTDSKHVPAEKEPLTHKLSAKEEKARRRKLKLSLSALLLTATAFSTWAGYQLRSSLAPVQARGPGQSSVTDPAASSLLQGRSPTGKPISPRLQSIADMAEFLEQQEQD